MPKPLSKYDAAKKITTRRKDRTQRENAYVREASKKAAARFADRELLAEKRILDSVPEADREWVVAEVDGG